MEEGIDDGAVVGAGLTDGMPPGVDSGAGGSMFFRHPPANKESEIKSSVIKFLRVIFFPFPP
jgi:hypothetical protein